MSLCYNSYLFSFFPV